MKQFQIGKIRIYFVILT